MPVRRSWRPPPRETRPFLGDTWAFARIGSLARATVPLLEVDAPGEVGRQAHVRVTEAGRRVLAGEADHAHVNGVDRWIGGVHLEGRHSPWRWDEGMERVVAVDVHADD